MIMANTIWSTNHKINKVIHKVYVFLYILNVNRIDFNLNFEK